MNEEVATAQAADAHPALAKLSELGVRAVRLQYADLHGICRGKEIPIGTFPHAAHEGIGFVAAIMTVDLAHNVVAGFEQGFPDVLARPDLETLVALPWEPDVAACIADLEDPATHESLRDRLARCAQARADALRRAWPRPGGGPRARVLSVRARPGLAAGLPPLRPSGQRRLHGGRRGRPERGAGAHARCSGRTEAGGDRSRARIRPQPVRDQPSPFDGT